MALDRGLDWLLDDLTSRVEHIRHALVLSNDGLVTGASAGLAREDAEHLAAVSSGLHSLARGSGGTSVPERRGRPWWSSTRHCSS